MTDDPPSSEVKDSVDVMYLPPYSPDLNPIELAFSYVKGYLKEHQDFLSFMPHMNVVRAAFNTITPQQCKGWILKSGYS